MPQRGQNEDFGYEHLCKRSERAALPSFDQSVLLVSNLGANGGTGCWFWARAAGDFMPHIRASAIEKATTLPTIETPNPR
jgi:hypothetical protein